MIENYKSQTSVKSELMTGTHGNKICSFKTNLIIESELITDNEFGSEIEVLEEMRSFIEQKIKMLKKQDGLKEDIETTLLKVLREKTGFLKCRQGDYLIITVPKDYQYYSNSDEFEDSLRVIKKELGIRIAIFRNGEKLEIA